MTYILKLTDNIEYKLPDGTSTTVYEIMHWKNRFKAMENKDAEACIESLKAVESFEPTHVFKTEDCNGFYSTGGLALSFKAGVPVTLTVNNVTYRVGRTM